MKQYFLTLILNFLAIVLVAQPNNSYNKNVIMPSPAAASLGKYGDIPVSYYTGVPNIGIPIHTLTDGPLGMSISLSYHASGVRVQEAAGWVGLNWNLNAGGAVSRTVQGLKDEDAVGGWYYKGDEIPSLGPTTQDTCNFYNFVPQVNSGVKDSEPDIFSFNAGGVSGKFYLTNNDNASVKVTLVPMQDVKIIPRFSSNTAETNHLKGFIIITPDGVKYHFGDIGDGNPAIETLAGGGGNYPEIPSSWYLKKIETHDGKYAINLTYVDEYSTSTYIPSHSSCDNTGSSNPPVASYGSNVKGKRLSTITTSLETVTFNASTATREDLALHPLGTNPPKSLASISITSGSFQKKFEFTYDYWLDNSSDAPTNGDITVKKRLRLTQVAEKSGDGTITNPPYVFDYFTQSGNPSFLPHRLSRSTDHWGFYNGKNNGSYILNTLNIGYQSATCINGQSCNNHKFSYPGTSDRETDEASMKFGTLKKITYPTGGYTEFDFEANDYYSTTPTTQKITLLNIPAASTCASFTVVGTPNPISFTTTDLPNLKYEMTLLSIGCTCPAQVSMEVKVYRVSDNFLVATSGQYQLNCNQAAGTGSVWEGALQPLFGNALAANVNYRFEIFFSKSHASFKIIKENTIASGNRKVGGLRIKQVTTHDGYSSANNIVRTYEYRDSVQTTRSSGILYQEPKYLHSYTWYPDTLALCVECSPDCGCNSTGGCAVNFFDISTVPLSSFEGYHIGYGYVKEIFPNNGYKTYAFQTESPASNNTYPAPPAPARIIAGNLRYTAVRDNSSNLKASETHVPYAEAYTNSTASMFKVSQQCGNFLTTYSIRTRPYREVSVANMVDGVTSAVIRTFDATNRFLFPVTEKTYNSDSKEFLTEYIYNHDYTTSSTIKDSLLARFLIATPWKTNIKVNGTQFDGTELEYAFFNNSTGAYQATGTAASPRAYKYYRFEKTWDASGNLTGSGKTLKGTTNSYDSKGNEISFTEAGWTDPEVYVWNTAGLLLSKTYKSHTVTYDYYSNTRLPKIVTDIDGRKTGYTFDKLMRLAKVTKDNASLDAGGNVVNGNVRSEYTYHYKEASPGDQYNWIKVKNTFTAVSGSNLTATETIEYLDGIGRSMQTVKKAWSPTNKDVVAAVAYDTEGRVIKQYTPFMTTTNTGAFATVPVNQKFTLTVYEASPLGRSTSVTAPDWYAVTSSYGANAANEVGYMNGSSST
ncbi:MAG: hypothetical protein JNJ57_21760, partial [Saprospiraceae bacterium]|nr:hypothetical protein [Saprospiraceae bacterium]